MTPLSGPSAAPARARFPRATLWLLGLAVLGPGSLTADRPNIVIIMADDLGYGDPGCLNPDSAIPTPHLDRLARSGRRYTDAHSPSAVCTPTRYGLLTGRYSWRTAMKSGVLGGYSKPLLEPGRPTIASFLQQHGYRTGAVGKWHLGMAMPLLSADAAVSQWQGDPGIDFAGVITDSPVHHGFDYYFGVSASLDMAPYAYIRNDRFTMLPSRQQPAVKFPGFVRQGPRAEDFVIDQVLDRLTDEAVRFIETRSGEEAPYFLYVPCTAPHKPVQPAAEFRGRTHAGDYGDFVAQVDAATGRILAAIEASGGADNTLVVFTSDNGSFMFRRDDRQPDHVDDPTIQAYRADRHRANGPWRGTKADIYEGGHRVPFLVRWPGRIEAGSQSGQTICHVDLFATCAEIIGAELPTGAAEDSFSFLDPADGQTRRRPVPVIHQSGSGMLALRDGPWKLVAGNGSGGRQKPAGKRDQRPFQLYNLADDPGEQRDVADQQPQRLAEMTDMLAALRAARGSRQYLQDRTGQAESQPPR